MVLFPTTQELSKLGYDFSTGPSYVAPSVYKLSGKTMSGYNYYKSSNDAFEKVRYLNNIPGAKNVTPVGTVSFKNTGAAETYGINCDFYAAVSPVNYIAIPFNLFRLLFSNKSIKLYAFFRFYKTDGSGPYYAVLDDRYFGIASTKIDATGEKLKAMETFYRELSLIKSKYNSLVTFLNELAQKPFTPATQEIFNRGMLLKDAMYQQISSIKDIKIVTNESGGIGIPLIPVIIWLVVIGTAGWVLNTWLTESQKTKRINEAFDMQKWLIEEQKKITNDFNNGKMTAEQYRLSMANIGIAVKTANDVAQKSSDSQKGVVGEIGDIVKWGVVGFIIYKGLDLVKTNNGFTLYQ